MTNDTTAHIIELGVAPATVPLHVTAREWPMLDNAPWPDGQREDPDMPIPYRLAATCPG